MGHPFAVGNPYRFKPGNQLRKGKRGGNVYTLPLRRAFYARVLPADVTEIIEVLLGKAKDAQHPEQLAAAHEVLRYCGIDTTYENVEDRGQPSVMRIELIHDDATIVLENKPTITLERPGLLPEADEPEERESCAV